jgi:hypothetical protein
VVEDALTPEQAAREIREILNRTRGGWEDKGELDGEPALLRGFYLCADFATAAGHGIFFSLSQDGGGNDLLPWTVEGYLNYALKHDLLGRTEKDEDDE